jgi:hypothetical protein
MGYATFNLKYRAGNNNSRVDGFMPAMARGAKQFNKPLGMLRFKAFLKLVKDLDVKVERKSFSQLVVNYN